MKIRFACLLLFAGVFPILGCGTSNPDVIDLNKVLDTLETTLNEQSGGAAPAETGIQVSGETAEVTAATINAIPPEKQDPTKEKTFLAAFATNLNKAKISRHTLGVSMNPQGDIQGFRDLNSNGSQDGEDTQAFTVTIDIDQSRLVATDGEGHYRPHSYRAGNGMLTGYLIGSMMGRQNTYYSGAMASSKPNYKATPMSPPDYHASAVKTAKTRMSSSSARVKTGSGGFSFGK